MLEAVKDVNFTINELELNIERVKNSLIQLSNRFQDSLSNEEEGSLIQAKGILGTMNVLYKEAIRIEVISDSLKSNLEGLMQI